MKPDKIKDFKDFKELKRGKSYILKNDKSAIYIGYYPEAKVGNITKELRNVIMNNTKIFSSHYNDDIRDEDVLINYLISGQHPYKKIKDYYLPITYTGRFYGLFLHITDKKYKNNNVKYYFIKIFDIDDVKIIDMKEIIKV